MADKKVSDLPSLNGADVDPADLLYIVDSSAGAAGSKKITVGQYQLAPVSGGTANTVVYLNGSKVESSSSALTFDGTNFATTGTSSAAKLIPTGGTATGNGMYLPAANTLAWSNNGAETMRLDSSGNLGIGTSSPATKLDVTGLVRSTTGINIGASIDGTTGGFTRSGADTYLDYAGTLRVRSGAASERVTLDSSGNLGIGTSSPLVKFDVKGTTDTHVGITASGIDEAIILAYDDGGIRTPNLSYGAASHKFLIDTTERMRLDSSGNLGLGVTPSAWGSAYKALQVSSGASHAGSSNAAFWYCNAYNDNTNWRYVTSTNASGYTQFGGEHLWFTAPSGTAGNTISFTQAMTLDASGNLDIGTTGGVDRYQNIIATSARLTFNAGTGFTGSAATSIYNQSAIAMVFGTNNTERARITSGGDLLVGTTSTTMGQTGVTIIPALGGQVGYIQIGHANGTSSGNGYADFFYNAVSIGSITQNGTTAVAFNTTSDRRLKDNIVPAPSASDVIDAIQIVSHDWKSAPDEHVTYGVIAQDLHAVAPQAVLQGDEGDAVEKPWGVDYSKLVPMLIKEIQSLRARVAALEAK